MPESLHNWAKPMVAPPAPLGSEWQQRMDSLVGNLPGGLPSARAAPALPSGRKRTRQEDGKPLVDIPEGALRPLLHARCCVCGIASVELLRLCAIHIYPSPGGLEYTSHMLSCASDVLAFLGSLPVFATSSLGTCVNHRCLGSLLTLLLTAATCDWGAAVIFLFPGGGLKRMAGPPMLDEGAPPILGFIGVWECIMLASVSLQLALCVCAWSFYRIFREAGIYPPNAEKAKIYKEVSPFEFLCEAEDVALLSDQCHGQCQRPPSMHCPEIAFAEDGIELPDMQRADPELKSGFTPAALQVSRKDLRKV
eukprot:TRINITY_DN24520_c0_g1_i1.p1 TRINITY_DN24520_c0_g1~~TRINITY_DN24520_c0_g1_i1.p1  ORF type:complete len:308 (-),score=52.46 TRINITY_DN24520_c0_g1_i1:79-1002(-)